MSKVQIDFIDNITTNLGSIKAVKMLSLPDVPINLVHDSNQVNATVQKHSIYHMLQF